MTRIITVEEHFDTPANIKNFNAFSKVKNNNPRQAELENDLTNFEAKLAYMDKYGIDMQVISDAGNSPQVLPDDMVTAACKEQNDSLAESVAQHPDRFAGLAVLPANQPEDAAAELERAVKELGLKGGIISGTVGGQFLDDPKFEAIFAKANELEVPLYLHPGVINDDQKAMLYESKTYSPMMATMMAGAAWGWHMEVGIQAVRLILGGITEKYPNLKLVTGHWGEFVPMFIERLDGFTAFANAPHPFSYYYKKNFYLTPSGMFTEPQLQLALTEMGADHILYSEDYPYLNQKETVVDFLQNVKISDSDREKIGHETAEKVFSL